jgi:hypothetical protein
MKQQIIVVECTGPDFHDTMIKLVRDYGFNGYLAVKHGEFIYTMLDAGWRLMAPPVLIEKPITGDVYHWWFEKKE